MTSLCGNWDPSITGPAVIRSCSTCEVN